MQISHETIYRSLFVQARGVLKKELVGHLRTRRVIRRPKTARTRGQERGQIVEAVSIRERPAEVEDRAVPGHWEGDLLAGSHNTHIATLVERQSRFTILVKVKSKDTRTVVRALGKQVRRLPAELRKSLTWDGGLEMAGHKEFSIATDVRVYFCDPQSPWQRGTNENTNRLLRQYFPKGLLAPSGNRATWCRNPRQSEDDVTASDALNLNRFVTCEMRHADQTGRCRVAESLVEVRGECRHTPLQPLLVVRPSELVTRFPSQSGDTKPKPAGGAASPHRFGGWATSSIFGRTTPSSNGVRASRSG